MPSPYDAWPAYAPIAEAMSGIYEFKRQGDQPPTGRAGRRAGRHRLGLFAVDRRARRPAPPRRHRRGQYVDIAMLDAMVAMTDLVTNFWSMGLRGGELGPLIMHGFRAARRLVHHPGRARAPVRSAGGDHRAAGVGDGRALRHPAGLGRPPRRRDPTGHRGLGRRAAPRSRPAMPCGRRASPPGRASPTRTWSTTRTSRPATCWSSIPAPTASTSRCSSPATRSSCRACRRDRRPGCRGSASTPTTSWRRARARRRAHRHVARAGVVA